MIQNTNSGGQTPSNSWRPKRSPKSSSWFHQRALAGAGGALPGPGARGQEARHLGRRERLPHGLAQAFIWTFSRKAGAPANQGPALSLACPSSVFWKQDVF